MTDSVFHKIFLITCTGFTLRQRNQTAVLHLNLWKLPHVRYSPAKHRVCEVHLIGYASYFNKKSNLSSKMISRSKKTHLWTSQLNFSTELFRHTTTRKQLLTCLISIVNTRDLLQRLDGWVRVLRPFNSISVISRRWKGEHERPCEIRIVYWWNAVTTITHQDLWLGN